MSVCAASTTQTVSDPSNSESRRPSGVYEISPSRYVPALDGVRAIAVLLVVISHYWHIFARGPYDFFGKFAQWGLTGVDLFFVLSGFLITGILLDARGSRGCLRNFYARRMLRIFPLYYCTLLLIYLVLPTFHLTAWTPWQKSVWFWVYLQNVPLTFAPSMVSGPKHFWSLAVEEHFYLVWPCVVLLLHRKWLLRACAFEIILSLAARIALRHYDTYYFTACRIDGLALGSAIAILSRSDKGGLSRYKSWAKALLVVLGPMLAFVQLSVSGRSLTLITIVKSPLVALIYGCALILVIENGCGPIVERVLCCGPIRSIGQYSYGMYVLHPFILWRLLRWGLPYGVFGLSVCTVLTYVAAFASWILLEKRFLKLKRHFEYMPDRRYVAEPNVKHSEDYEANTVLTRNFVDQQRLTSSTTER